MKKLFNIFYLIWACDSLQAQIINTIAGTTAGYSGDNGLAVSCQLYSPCGIAFDTIGNLYIADFNNNVIRKVNTVGVITTVAGNGTAGFGGDGGIATSAQLNNPVDVKVDDSCNIYIAEQTGQRVRKVNSLGVINTIAGTGVFGFSGDGGQATLANLGTPEGIALDKAGNLYIAEYANNRIRKVNLSGVINTIAGNGTIGYSGDWGQAVLAQLKNPSSIVIDELNNVYFTECGNNVVRKIDPTGIISTVAGNGTQGYTGDGSTATSASFSCPHGINVDAANNIFVSDANNNVIRKTSNIGIINTIAGNGTGGYSGDGTTATLGQLNSPIGLACDKYGSLYIGDGVNNVIRKVTNACVVDINQLEENDLHFSVFPNPSSGNFTVKYNIQQNATLELFDVQGKKMFSIKLSSIETGEEVRTSDLLNGVYMYKLVTPSNVLHNGRLVIIK